MSSDINIAFVGIGLMGAPMVQRLIDGKQSLVLWNRTVSKAKQFEHHAAIAKSVEDALNQADIVITMLENAQVVDELIFRSSAYKQLRSGSLFIDMSSIPPSIARSHAETLKEQGVRYLDAPVSGGTVGATEGSLSIMVGGSKDDFDDAKSIFGLLGTPTYIGETGCGQLTKLANQAIVGITIGAISEALLLAAQGGADLNAVRQALLGGFAASRILDLHGQRMIERNFKPGATSRVQLKDMRTILNEANDSGLTLPLAQRTYEAYLSLIANGHEDVDHSGLLLELEHLNQVQLN